MAILSVCCFREDGKDCMKFYTDPSYFFELWYSEIQKDITSKKQELKKKREGKKVMKILHSHLKHMYAG